MEMIKNQKIKKIFITTFFIFLVNCNIKERLQTTPMPTYVEKPPELLWQDANRYLKKKYYTEAASAFEEIDKQHPYSKLAKKGQIMSAFAHYTAKEYNSSIFSIDRFISLYPADKKISYMLYLKGLCYYEQINNPTLDQSPSQKSKVVFEELIKRHPNSNYTKDAKKKMFLINDQLAANEMTVGRFYQKKDRHLAAIERFKVVVENYGTTAQTPEALYRLTESYMSLGILEEAQKTTAVLAYNYKRSNWYKLSYKLLKKYGYVKDGKKS